MNGNVRVQNAICLTCRFLQAWKSVQASCCCTFCHVFKMGGAGGDSFGLEVQDFLLCAIPSTLTL